MNGRKGRGLGRESLKITKLLIVGVGGTTKNFPICYNLLHLWEEMSYGSKAAARQLKCPEQDEQVQSTLSTIYTSHEIDEHHIHMTEVDEHHIHMTEVDENHSIYMSSIYI